MRNAQQFHEIELTLISPGFSSLSSSGTAIPTRKKQRDPVLAAPLMAMTLGCCQWLPCTEKPWTQALLLRNLLSESLAGKRRPVFHIFPVSRAVFSERFHPSNFQPTLEHAVTCSSSGLKLQSSCHPNPEPW